MPRTDKTQISIAIPKTLRNKQKRLEAKQILSEIPSIVKQHLTNLFRSANIEIVQGTGSKDYINDETKITRTKAYKKKKTLKVEVVEPNIPPSGESMVQAYYKSAGNQRQAALAKSLVDEQLRRQNVQRILKERPTKRVVKPKANVQKLLKNMPEAVIPVKLPKTVRPRPTKLKLPIMIPRPPKLITEKGEPKPKLKIATLKATAKVFVPAYTPTKTKPKTKSKMDKIKSQMKKEVSKRKKEVGL
jgi:hypothetical protein